MSEPMLPFGDETVRLKPDPTYVTVRESSEVRLKPDPTGLWVGDVRGVRL